MGFIGGAPAYWLLKRFWPGGQNIPMSNGDPYAERGVSKLKALFGPDVFDQFSDKVVLDFGCGLGGNAIEIAQNGCPKVIGLDILPHYIEKARRTAQAGPLYFHFPMDRTR